MSPSWLAGGHYLATLIFTAVPGTPGLGFFLIGMLIAWASDVHTFASSWMPIRFAYAVTSPFFLPPIVAGIPVLVHNRTNGLKVAVVALGIGVLYALCVYRGFFG